MAEKNKFCLRIERLTMGASKNRPKSSQEEVEEALKYVAELEHEPSDGDGIFRKDMMCVLLRLPRMEVLILC